MISSASHDTLALDVANADAAALFAIQLSFFPGVMNAEAFHQQQGHAQVAQRTERAGQRCLIDELAGERSDRGLACLKLAQQNTVLLPIHIATI
jgi:hypothetical protein